jgi:hypothetical protein
MHGADVSVSALDMLANAAHEQLSLTTLDMLAKADYGQLLSSPKKRVLMYQHLLFRLNHIRKGGLNYAEGV